MALIEKRYSTSLKEMKSARGAAEKLLAADPTYYDAWIAVGVENYMLSVKPAPVRWMLRMTGAQTDRAFGMEKLRLTAEKGRYLAPFARLLLAVAALRDKDVPKARELLAGLTREFPKNPLYTQELARINTQACRPPGELSSLFDRCLYRRRRSGRACGSHCRASPRIRCNRRRLRDSTDRQSLR